MAPKTQNPHIMADNNYVPRDICRCFISSLYLFRSNTARDYTASRGYSDCNSIMSQKHISNSFTDYGRNIIWLVARTSIAR